MPVKTIYLIRHGETDFNKMGIFQGSGIDSELNEMGILQAEAFYSKYAHIPFQKVYTSKLIRTKQSVQKFLKDGVAHEALDGLNELSWGDKEGDVMNFDDPLYKNLIENWSRGKTDVAIGGGESPKQVAERQRLALEYILTQDHERLVLMAMHGRAMRILLTQISNLPLSKMDDFHHSNLCLYKLEYLYKSQTFKILESNNTAHLHDISI